MRPERRRQIPWWLKYSCALVVVAGGLGLERLVTALFGQPVMLILAAAVAFIFIGIGIGPGVLALAVAVAAGDYTLVQPTGTFSLDQRVLRIGIDCLTAAFVAYAGMVLYDRTMRGQLRRKNGSS